MLILGVDPGLARTGWGAICLEQGKNKYIASGLICTHPHQSQIERLGIITQEMKKVLKEQTPELICVERVFININPKTSLALGEARGALIATLLGSSAAVVEMSALQIKQTITGLGRANKNQVSDMVCRNLALVGQSFANDCTDALACAIAAIASIKNPLFHSTRPKRQSIRRRRR